MQIGSKEDCTVHDLLPGPSFGISRLLQFTLLKVEVESIAMEKDKIYARRVVLTTSHTYSNPSITAESNRSLWPALSHQVSLLPNSPSSARWSSWRSSHASASKAWTFSGWVAPRKSTTTYHRQYVTPIAFPQHIKSTIYPPYLPANPTN